MTPTIEEINNFTVCLVLGCADLYLVQIAPHIAKTTPHAILPKRVFQLNVSATNCLKSTISLNPAPIGHFWHFFSGGWNRRMPPRRFWGWLAGSGCCGRAAWMG